MDVYDYIKNYAAFHGIERYNLKAKYVTKAQLAETMQLSGGVAFFYKLFAEGEIIDQSSLVKKFLEINTPTDFWDLSPVVEVVDFGTLQKVQTDFIFTADNTIDFTLYEGTADAMFNNVVNFCALYMYMTPLEVSDSGTKMATANAATNPGATARQDRQADDLIIITD